MTPDKLRTLRLKLRDNLWHSFPRATAIEIWQAVNALLPLMVRESFNLVEMEHASDCACWNCIESLHADIVRVLAESRVAQEASEEHD